MDRENALIQVQNYEYSINVVQAAIRLGCSQIISAGSQAEYGIFDKKITEDTLCEPVSEYGKKKLMFYNTLPEICHKKYISFKEPRFYQERW